MRLSLGIACGALALSSAAVIAQRGTNVVRPQPPANDPRTDFRGPIARTVLYPPGDGGLRIVTATGLTRGADGYYVPSAPANSFSMRIPPSAWRAPITIACWVRGRPYATTSLWWTWAAGGTGGGVGFTFPHGESEARYTIGVGTNSAAITLSNPVDTIWFSLPPGTALKECRVSGTFLQTRP